MIRLQNLQTTLNVPMPHAKQSLRVTAPVSKIDNKAARRREVAAMLKIINAEHKDTLERLAK